jgi:uncharacterized protein
MGSILGPMLQKDLKKRWGIQAKRWGKASSGLARPDFHDWPSEVPNLMRRHRPDYVVVSLGTNDHQALKTQKSWIKTSNERWASSYKQRVLIMLRRLSGRDRKRAIVWLGPTNFDSNNARKLGPKLNELIREAIEEFDGPAVFVDARRATSDSQGGAGVTYRHPKKGQRPMRTKDGIHLTTEAVRTLLAAPVYDAFASCWDGDVATRDAIRQQRKDERLAKRKAKREAAKAKREEAAAKAKTSRTGKPAKAPRTTSPRAVATPKPVTTPKPVATPAATTAPKITATPPSKVEKPEAAPTIDVKKREDTEAPNASPKTETQRAPLKAPKKGTKRGQTAPSPVAPAPSTQDAAKQPADEQSPPNAKPTPSGDAPPEAPSKARPKTDDESVSKGDDKASTRRAPEPSASPAKVKDAEKKKSSCGSKKAAAEKDAPPQKPAGTSDAPEEGAD